MPKTYTRSSGSSAGRSSGGSSGSSRGSSTGSSRSVIKTTDFKSGKVLSKRIVETSYDSSVDSQRESKSRSVLRSKRSGEGLTVSWSRATGRDKVLSLLKLEMAVLLMVLVIFAPVFNVFVSYSDEIGDSAQLRSEYAISMTTEYNDVPVVDCK